MRRPRKNNSRPSSSSPPSPSAAPAPRSARSDKPAGKSGSFKKFSGPGSTPKGAKPGSRGFAFKDRSGRVHVIGTAPDRDAGEKAGKDRERDYPSRSERKTQREEAGISKPPRIKPIQPASARPVGKISTKYKPKPHRKGEGKNAKRGDRPEGRRGGRDHHREERGERGVNITAKATVDKNRKGFGFLIYDDRGREDGFIPPREAENLFHGDRVEVTVDSRGHIQNLKVLQHRFREVVGRFNPHPMGSERGGWVTYERKRAREEIFVPTFTLPAKPGDWVQAKLEFHESGPFPVTAVITQVFGAELPPSADVGMVAAEYNLIEEHPEAAEAEAKSFTLDLNDKRVLENRVDLRNIAFITIDGETARDFDDAVFVEKFGKSYVLWVAIADVSHYVRPETALNTDAYSRGTSVYFPERAFHMLPRALSENLCSLRPNEPRLTLVAKMRFNDRGQIGQTEVMEAIIESKRRATYNEIQAEFEANRTNPEWEYTPHFELYAALRKMRTGRGSIDFDLPEAELKVEPTGEVISIKNRARVDSHRLIEEFMIAANEAVTVWALARKWPFLYRVHDEPTAQAIEKFRKLAANVGVNLKLSGSVTPRTLADVVQQVAGHPAQELLNIALLRSMRQAAYSSVHAGHYGLASEAYTHFTSPIRRYPDLIVHRMLRKALRVEAGKEQPLGAKERDRLEKELAEIAEHCSYRERLATDAERESIKLKQVRLMTKHVGEEFDGKIIGLAEPGIFVQLDDPYVEGMLPKDSLSDDQYEFDEDRMAMIGRRKRETFKIGDRLKIKVVKASIDLRQVEFGLVKVLTRQK